jgi:hypothetical protein
LTRGPTPSTGDLYKLLEFATSRLGRRRENIRKVNVIKVLLEYGAPIDSNITTNNLLFRFTPLIYAIREKKTDVVKLFLNQGANPNKRDREGFTPLQRAAMEPNNAPIIRLLVERGANVDVKNTKREETALHIAVMAGVTNNNNQNMSNIRALVDIGKAKVNVRDVKGNTPLHDAVWWNERAVQFLVDRGAHVNAKNDRGRTALHIAVVLGKTKLVRVLLEHGAIPFIQDRDGRTPSDIANTVNIKRLIRTWPGERSARRRMAMVSMNGVRNRNGQRIHVPNNIKQRILSKTGLFNRNQFGRPINTKNMSQAEIRNAWRKEQNKRRRQKKRKRRT